MFNGDLHDDWKWIPLFLIFGAIAFLFFDPLGMNGTNITYVINAVQPQNPVPIPPPPVVPPGQPPPGPPPIAGFPTFETTGPKTVPATQYTGPAIINQNGATFDGYIFSGCIQIVADNVTIQNSRIVAACNGAPMIWHREGINLQVIDSELIGLKDGTGLPVSGVTCSSCTVQGNRVRGTADGFNPNGTAQIIGNYIGQLGGGIVNGNPTYNDGFQIANGDGVVIRGNTVYNDCGVSRQEAGGQGGCNAAIFFQPYCAGCIIAGATIEGNYFRKWNGPTGSVLSIVTADGSTGIKVNNNTFGDVPVVLCMISNGGIISEWVGNKREDGTDVVKNC